MTSQLTVCRVCGQDNGKTLRRFDKIYNRCRSCDTLQLSITRDEYLAIDRGYDPGDYLTNKSETYVRAYLNVEPKKHVIEKVVKALDRPAQNLSFLDVGCGMGGYMLAARELGMDVFGFEPSTNHGRVAKNLLGLPVISDYYSSDKVGNRKFDIIFLSHVIEHIYDPAPFVTDLTLPLKPGGILMMITPNANSLTARSTGKNWPMLEPVDHVTMLSKSSVPHLMPKDCTVSLSSSEHPFEFLATWASVFKRKFKRTATQDINNDPHDSPQLIKEVSLRSKLVKLVLSIGSMPFYAVSRATQNSAALIIMVKKS